jgi:hypothetical protein
MQKVGIVIKIPVLNKRTGTQYQHPEKGKIS